MRRSPGNDERASRFGKRKAETKAPRAIRVVRMTWHLRVLPVMLAAISCGGEAVSGPSSAVPTASAVSSSASASPASAPASGAASTPATTPEVEAKLPALTAEQVNSLLVASDRTEADRKVDKVRHPDQLLAFLGVGPSMRVADLGAGGGYTTELLARAVGSGGDRLGTEDRFVFKFVKP